MVINVNNPERNVDYNNKHCLQLWVKQVNIKTLKYLEKPLLSSYLVHVIRESESP